MTTQSMHESETVLLPVIALGERDIEKRQIWAERRRHMEKQRV